MQSKQLKGSVILTLTIWALVIVASLPLHAQGDAGKDFVGTSQCKVCHNKESEGSQFDTWQKMKHANAFNVLSTDAALEVATKLGLEEKPSESPKCLKCHVTSYDVETKTVHPKVKMEEGVQCESCHGPSSAHLKDGKTLMLKKDADIDVLANIVRPDKTVCVKCHNEENPTWNPEKYTLENGDKVGFDFDQAYAVIAHPNPKKQAEAAE